MSSKIWKPVKPQFVAFKKDVFAKAALVSGFIYQIGESQNLRKSSSKVSINKIKSEEFQQKIKYLKNCLLKYRELTGQGRGIAGVQVGIPERFAVVYTSEKLITIINPKITKKSKQMLIYPEMCMSAAPIIAPVARPSWIEFEYFDELGLKKFWKTKDKTKIGRMLNRVFQHEIDHMDGIINIDLVNRPKDLILHSDPNFYKNAKFEKI